MSIYQYNGKQYGIPWDMGMVGFWYNKDAVRAGRHHRPAGDLGRVPRRRRQAQGRGHHARSPSPARTSGRRCTCGRTSSLRIGGGEALQQMVQTGDWNTDACIKAGEAVVALNAT